MEDKKFAREMVEKLRELVRKGNVTRVEVGRNGQQVVSFPVTVGVVVGVAVAPWALILAAVATLGAQCSVDVVKENGEVIHLA